ncbi:carboxylesterase family protein [Microbacterium sp. NPDC076895]|uniref:carboxylesterase/lipase family protein n=1 Tax=Microbacterium sp. NPDC076895 TaxID=3154957 RepID=UPI00343E1D67
MSEPRVTTEGAEVLVATPNGQVRGLWREPRGCGKSAAFLGIPFAQPPTGALKFEAPVPVEPWDGVRDATEYGPTPQRHPAAEITLIPEPSVSGDSTLNVNVFTPRPGDTAALLPVMVYIHGGGYVSGSPASPWYDGAAFNRDGVVTVTVSYRLGFEGFGHIDGCPENRGARDWLAALEWVRRTIAVFGGDPGNVTIAGQSAGGGAVLTLLGMPAARGLFHRAWALSPGVAEVTRERAEAVADRIAKLAGVPATKEGFASVDPDELVELENQATNLLADTNVMAGIRGLLAEGLSLGPVVDGELIPQPILAAYGDGVGADIPLVIGSTQDEMTMIADSMPWSVRLVPPSALLRALGVDRPTRRSYLRANAHQRRRDSPAVLGRYLGDAMLRVNIPRVAAAREGAHTWAYVFAWPSASRGWALHCLDVPFWFDCLADKHVPNIAGDAPPQSVADDIHGAAVAFVASGDPGWPTWSSTPGMTRIFDTAGEPLRTDGYAELAALV